VRRAPPARRLERPRQRPQRAPADHPPRRSVAFAVAEFISARDGYPASPDDIFLTDGASAGVKAMCNLLIRGPQDAVIAPVPQYPLYSATASMLDGTLVPYYLDEAAAWGVTEEELQAALARATAQGATARALVVINPGNPTGQSLPAAVIHRIMAFAAEHSLVLMADEVYQENVYGGAPAFCSFKKALSELRAKGDAGDAAAAATAAAVQLVSFHSTSKGFIGECGLRGGYFELQGVPHDVRAQITKLASVSLCSNVVGQFTTGLMLKPPVEGEPSYATYAAERAGILGGMASRAKRIADALNELPGLSCNAAEGAMYLFPRVALPPKAIEAAAAAGIAAPDEWYCLKLLEATGLVVVPGSGFGQADGTFHFRTTFLPPDDALRVVLPKLADFHNGLMAEYA
jgi:alanine transaminase